MRRVLFGVLWTVVFLTGAARADDTIRCEAAKNRIAGKYASCRQAAVGKGLLSGSGGDFARCDTQLAAKWTTAESAGGLNCPTTGDRASIQGVVTAHSATVAALLSGSGGPVCGDDAINVAGEQCDGSDLGGATCASLGLLGGTLACSGSCTLDASGCALSSTFPASGQTTSYGAGSDGNLQPGATLSFTDNGDGTVTDNNTGLMWEKKGDAGGVHDKDNTYAWGITTSPYSMNGTVVTSFLNVLNDVIGGGANCFASHCDWRLPTVKELQSILDYQVSYPGPVVGSAFHTANCTGCADIAIANCTCTVPNNYWTSTTYQDDPRMVFYVSFDEGDVDEYFKTFNYPARAVRGGL